MKSDIIITRSARRISDRTGKELETMRRVSLPEDKDNNCWTHYLSRAIRALADLEEFTHFYVVRKEQ